MYIPKTTHKGSTALVILDIAVLAVAPFIASAIRFSHTGDPFRGVLKHPIGFLIAGLIYFLLLFIADLHNSSKEYRSIHSFVEIGLVIVVGFVLSIFLFYCCCTY